MHVETSKPLARLTFPAADIIANHPPVLHDRNKRIVDEIACPPGAVIGGEVTFTRWRAMTLPAHVHLQRSMAIEEREDIYDYKPAGPDGSAQWHVNFADPSLFFGYGTGLFAQDEMQVAEHPVLASLLEKLRATGVSTQTVDGRTATPVLVRGAERRVWIETDSNANQGRPEGLYGTRFADAKPDAIRRATRRIVPPTITNLIAIAAPNSGWGRYSVENIEDILTIAFSGFRAAVIESTEMAAVGAAVVIHTGFWGCGAFGGNRVLMPLLQLIAAQMADVDRLVFHSVNHVGSADFGESLRLYDRLKSGLASPPIEVGEVVRQINQFGLSWGVGDGN